jgi:hypothetical protein
MLRLLMDAHISPVVPVQVKAVQPEIIIRSLQEWRDGAFLGSKDDIILAEAQKDGLTFVTYDQRTIAPLIAQWAVQGRDHTGVIFIYQKSIAQADIGGKVRALLALWSQGNTLDWTNAVGFLKLES